MLKSMISVAAQRGPARPCTRAGVGCGAGVRGTGVRSWYPDSRDGTAVGTGAGPAARPPPSAQASASGPWPRSSEIPPAGPYTAACSPGRFSHTGTCCPQPGIPHS